MNPNPQSIYYILGSLAVLAAASRWLIYKPISYFLELRFLLRTIVGDVQEIKTNHLPHIYDRLGTFEKRLDEIREDSSGDDGRSSGDAGERRSDAD